MIYFRGLDRVELCDGGNVVAGSWNLEARAIAMISVLENEFWGRHSHTSLATHSTIDKVASYQASL